MSSPVLVDDYGARCHTCFGGMYVVKIQRGPRIGVRITYRHVERHPTCGQPSITVDKR